MPAVLCFLRAPCCGLAVLLSLLLSACGGGSDAAPPSALSLQAQVGELAFNEPLLSASGRLSCAGCHASATGHAAPNALAVQMGGTQLTVAGLRSSPSIRYLVANTGFHFEDDGTPAGGFFWDGRADTLAQQAGGPLLNPREMANASKAEVVARIAATPWADRFRAAFGERILDDADQAFDSLTQAIAQFQREDLALHAYTSKYDEVLRGRAQLSAQEARGLALFNDPAKGNCASCHTSTRGADGSLPLFTDFTYDNLGVPRNPEIPANQDPAYYDLGLCGRPELASRQDLCGAFKVPSLRNVALRQSFFHNGRFKSLKDALTFYVQRDTAPQKWYPVRADGTVDKFDDLPEALRANVNTSEAPYDRQAGDAPALGDAEIDDVIAFLKTLTDDWRGD